MMGFVVEFVLKAVHFPERFEVFILNAAVVIVDRHGHRQDFLPKALSHKACDVEMQLFVAEDVAGRGHYARPGCGAYPEYLEGKPYFQGVAEAAGGTVEPEARETYCITTAPGAGSAPEIISSNMALVVEKCVGPRVCSTKIFHENNLQHLLPPYRN